MGINICEICDEEAGFKGQLTNATWIEIMPFEISKYICGPCADDLEELLNNNQQLRRIINYLNGKGNKI